MKYWDFPVKEKQVFHCVTSQ